MKNRRITDLKLAEMQAESKARHADHVLAVVRKRRTKAEMIAARSRPLVFTGKVIKKEKSDSAGFVDFQKLKRFALYENPKPIVRPKAEYSNTTPLGIAANLHQGRDI